MGIPIATKYTTSATDLIQMKFRCSSCGAKHPVSVLTTSLGSSIGLPLGLGAEGHAQEASAAAESGLSAEARTLVSLARCPSCGRRDFGNVSPAAVLLLPGPLGLGAFAGVFAGLIMVLMGVSFLAVFLPVMLVTAAALNAWMTRNRLRDVDHKVEFQTTEG